MASAVTKLPKPKLRGHFQSYLNGTFIVSTLVSVTGGALFYVGVILNHRKRREEMFKNYNADKEFERLRDLGVFWSVPPKDPSKALYNFQGEMP